MKKNAVRLLLSLLAICAMVFMVAGCGGDKKADQKVLRVGTNADFAPFEFQDVNGKNYEGFDMDLIRAVGKEMGYEVKIQNINFDGLIPSLETGNIDVIISGMTINDERKKKVAFSAPYYKSGLTIVVRNNTTGIQKFADLKGKKVAVQIGTTSAAEVRKIDGVIVKDMPSSAETFLELRAGGVDAVVNDRPVNEYYLAQNKQKDMKELEDLLTSEDYGIAVLKKNTALLKEIDQALTNLNKNGEYQKIYKKWFSVQ